MHDVAIIGAGIAGMATATRLRKQGLATIVFEAHGQPGGCAGFYRRKGFAFDVGATTLVDFEPGGVGAEWLASIGMPDLEGEALPGYMAWLPDRMLTLHREAARWAAERLETLGDTPDLRAFWALLDQLASVFWRASRRGIKLPIQNLQDLVKDTRALGLVNLPLARYLNWTMGDALRAFNLSQHLSLVGLLSMLIEDTVHSSVEQAPLINAALGATIRGAGLTRARGGMRGFWQQLVAHYRGLGGELRVGCKVERISGRAGHFLLQTRRGTFQAAQVVCALPASAAARLAPELAALPLAPYLRRDASAQGGACVVCLGVPEQQVAGQSFTHHQLLHSYDQPLGNGNNMFISVSAPGDLASAPPGQRSVMLSTHCPLAEWEQLTPAEYQERKQVMGEKLLALARRVYPNLGEQALVYEIGTPRSYERFAARPRGAVGGTQLTLWNANQQAIPHDIGVPGFWLVGDTTWPGLGTVACVLGSKIVADYVTRGMRAQRSYFLSRRGGIFYGNPYPTRLRPSEH